jgi:NifU-like protein involved in Fe-S cluster formation
MNAGPMGQRYSAAVVERVREMARVGAWPAAPGIGTGEAGAIDSGTFVRIQVRAAAAGDRRFEAVYKVFGCSAAIASASLVAEWIEQERPLRVEDVMATLELPAERAHAARMATEAATRALAACRRREPTADSR